MLYGYYKERADLIDVFAGSDVAFGFMENDDIGGGLDISKYNLYDFLHGYCDIFATALHDKFGYKIEYLYGPDGSLAHAYAIATDKNDKKTYYIDVRGLCDEWDTFVEEFEDFIETNDRRELDIRLYNLVEHAGDMHEQLAFAKEAIALQPEYYSIQKEDGFWPSFFIYSICHIKIVQNNIL